MTLLGSLLKTTLLPLPDPLPLPWVEGWWLSHGNGSLIPSGTLQVRVAVALTCLLFLFPGGNQDFALPIPVSQFAWTASNGASGRLLIGTIYFFN